MPKSKKTMGAFLLVAMLLTSARSLLASTVTKPGTVIPISPSDGAHIVGGSWLLCLAAAAAGFATSGSVIGAVTSAIVATCSCAEYIDSFTGWAAEVCSCEVLRTDFEGLCGEGS